MHLRIVSTPRILRYALIAVVAFTMGAAGTVAAARPIDLFRLADGTNDTRVARVDADGSLAVNVSNLPATQPVSGSVSVGNFPAIQAVSGSVTVGNFPATQPVSGSVSVGNFPETQTVAGTVQVGNWPTTVLLVDRNPWLIGTGQHFTGDMIDTSRFARISVSASADASNPNTITITLKRRGTAVATFTLAPGGTAGGNFDIMATQLEIDINGGPMGSPYTVQLYNLQIWAR